MARRNGPIPMRVLRGRGGESGDGQPGGELPGGPDVDVARLERAALSRFHAQHAVFDHSIVGIASIGRGTLQSSPAGVVIARSLACDEVHAGILISPIVRGEVHTWIDFRTAVAIGLGMGLARALLGGVRAALRRR